MRLDANALTAATARRIAGRSIFGRLARAFGRRCVQLWMVCAGRFVASLSKLQKVSL
jgi:hypothetical protein